jgi:formate hydrogenlyase subunit 3/multisubunit Na+/H+ antiporter MnhD subunit
MDILLLIAIAGPLLIGVALPAMACLRPAFPRSDRGTVVPLWIAALSTLGLAALLPWAGSDLALSIQWMPGAGPMAMGLGATGLYVALATTGACALTLWGARAVRARAVRARTVRAPWMGALILFSIAAAQIAFLTEHFLARYVALELVALCVALAPLVERRSADGEVSQGGRTGGALARLVYLLLRLGDAGLLVAILVLWSAGGTLEIAPALEAGTKLDPVRLNWVVAGFVLAVWIKVGGWPLHVWLQVGDRLSLYAHTWLYATLMPNLGLYLLYRVTPLLVQSDLIRGGAYWVGALGAALAATLALLKTRSRLRSTFVFLGAALGGLALVLAACGLKTIVWMTALILTPLRLALYLAEESAVAASAPLSDLSMFSDRAGPRRVFAAGLYSLGALALAGYCVLCAWWVRQAGAPPVVLWIVECAVAAICIWAVRSAWLLWRPIARFDRAARDVLPGRRSLGSTPALALLGLLLLAGLLSFGPLTRHLTAVAHGPSLLLPTPLHLAGYLSTTPAFWAVALLAVVARRFWVLLQGRSLGAPESTVPDRQMPERQARDLDKVLAQAAPISSSTDGVGIQERVLGGIVRVALGSARATYRIVEQRILTGGIHWVSEAAVGGGRLAYRVLEQEGLEGLLHGTVQAVQAGGRHMQRWHTGRLRRNLLWVAASLILAIVALALDNW